MYMYVCIYIYIYMHTHVYDVYWLCICSNQLSYLNVAPLPKALSPWEAMGAAVAIKLYNILNYAIA